MRASDARQIRLEDYLPKRAMTTAEIKKGKRPLQTQEVIPNRWQHLIGPCSEHFHHVNLAAPDFEDMGRQSIKRPEFVS
jgi:hypothetical protein